MVCTALPHPVHGVISQKTSMEDQERKIPDIHLEASSKNITSLEMYLVRD